MKKLITMSVMLLLCAGLSAQQKAHTKKAYRYYIIVLSYQSHTSYQDASNGSGQVVVSDVGDCHCSHITEDAEAKLLDDYERLYGHSGDNHPTERVFTFLTYKGASEFRRSMQDGGYSRAIQEGVIGI